MKTVVITGSARGLGLEMAKAFRLNNYNVVICDINKDNLDIAEAELNMLSGAGQTKSYLCNVCKLDEVEKTYAKAKDHFGAIDVWVNNAGVNQASKHAWELSDDEINFLINVDLKGTINGSLVAMREMKSQGYGAIYNVEGFGSNDAYQENLVMYGTTKRAVTYFTIALAKESEITKSNIIVGRLSPGIMITNFLTSAHGKDNNTDLSDKVKKVYNILGDYPDTVAKYLVKKMINNQKNNKQISWLTGGKAFWRFLTASFNKRDFFKSASEETK